MKILLTDIGGLLYYHFLFPKRSPRNAILCTIKKIAIPQEIYCSLVGMYRKRITCNFSYGYFGKKYYRKFLTYISKQKNKK